MASRSSSVNTPSSMASRGSRGAARRPAASKEVAPGRHSGGCRRDDGANRAMLQNLRRHARKRQRHRERRRRSPSAPSPSISCLSSNVIARAAAVHRIGLTMTPPSFNAEEMVGICLPKFVELEHRFFGDTAKLRRRRAGLGTPARESRRAARALRRLRSQFGGS